MTKTPSSGKDELLGLANASEEARGLRALSKQKATLGHLRSLLQSAAADLEEIEEASQIKEWLLESSGQPIKIPKRRKGAKPATTPVVAASDWHSAQIVKPSAVGGLNEHSPEIGQERAQKFARDVAKRIKFQQGAFQIDDVILWLGGDFMVGEIHGVDSARACEMAPLEEVSFCRDVLSGVITHLLGELDVRLHIVCNWGNHGRTTEKPRSTRKHAYSYEQFLYTQLAQDFADEPRVCFDVSESPWKVVEVGGLRLVTHHGDGIMGRSAGKGVGGLAVPFLRLAKDVLAQHDADFLMIGHYHTYAMWRLGGINGSLVGIDEYAFGRGLRAERPTQVMFQIDHERSSIGTVIPIWAD